MPRTPKVVHNPGPDFGQQTGGNAGNNKQDGGVTDVDFEEVK